MGPRAVVRQRATPVTSALINCTSARVQRPNIARRGRKNASSRALSAREKISERSSPRGESIILIEGGAAIGQRPPRPFIYYRHYAIPPHKTTLKFLPNHHTEPTFRKLVRETRNPYNSCNQRSIISFRYILRG